MKRQRGFVLLDAVVGVIILSIGIAGLTGLAATARKALYLSHWKMEAVNEAQSLVEQIKADGIDQSIGEGRVLPGGTVFIQGENSINLKVESAWEDESASLLRLKVSGEWAYGPGQGSVTLETLLARK